ncbi:MAG: hypothetical protein IKX79_04590 [Desulfovibrionaceae bacterium]|nr:hypothetical protein [Desulfovibrionaceae bacterium]
MANLCENEVVITGAPSDVDSAIEKLFTDVKPDGDAADGSAAQPFKAARSAFLAEARIYGDALFFSREESAGGSRVEWCFSSAWEPPFEVLEKLSAECPGISIDLRGLDVDAGDGYSAYRGKNGGFFGRFTFKGGSCKAYRRTKALFNELHALFVGDEDDDDDEDDE